MSEDVVKLLVAMLLSNLQGMKRNVEHSIQSKLLSRWGMNSNQIIRQHNLLSTEIVEQMGQISMIGKGGDGQEKPLDIMGALGQMIGTAKPEVKVEAPVVVDAPPGWIKDAAGTWHETK